MIMNKQLRVLPIGYILSKYRVDKIIYPVSPMKNMIYFGTATDDKKKVVIKACSTYNRRYTRRLRRECDALKKINHPNVVKLLDWIEEDTMICLVTRFEGLKFQDYLNMHAPLPLSSAKSLLLSILNALEYIHNTHQLEHRDLHIDNVVINNTQTPCLIDFEIIRKRRYRRKICDYFFGIFNFSCSPLYCFPNDMRRFAQLAFIVLTGKKVSNVNKIKNITHIQEKIRQARINGYNEEILQMVAASTKLNFITQQTVQAWRAILSKN